MATQRTKQFRLAGLLFVPGLALLLMFALGRDGCVVATPLVKVKPEYRYFVVGNPRDVATATRPGLVLEGGGTDIDQSFEWMISRSGGGDFVVIRATGSDAYNQYIAEMVAPDGRTADSVATLIIPSRAAAHDPFVAETIRNAEALWIAGGNQAHYLVHWKGTPVEDAIHHVIAKGAPVGGTSSGLAVMGEFSYSAERDRSVHDDLKSAHALGDPNHLRVTLHRDFLHLPFLKGVLVDSHFVQHDRMGRMLAFLGRIAHAGWAKAEEVKGIGIERETALLVEPDGRVQVIGRPHFPRPAAYFFRLTRPPEVCEPGRPLVLRDVRVDLVTPSGQFDLNTWTATEGVSFTLSAEGGRTVPTAPAGRIYP